jgi:hypothetical protein
MSLRPSGCWTTNLQGTLSVPPALRAAKERSIKGMENSPECGGSEAPPPPCSWARSLCRDVGSGRAAPCSRRRPAWHLGPSTQDWKLNDSQGTREAAHRL